MIATAADVPTVATCLRRSISVSISCDTISISNPLETMGIRLMATLVVPKSVLRILRMRLDIVAIRANTDGLRRRDRAVGLWELEDEWFPQLSVQPSLS